MIPTRLHGFHDAGHFCPDAVKAFDGTLDFPSVAGVAFDQKMFTTRYPFKYCTDKHVEAGSVIFRNDGKVARGSYGNSSEMQVGALIARPTTFSHHRLHPLSTHSPRALAPPLSSSSRPLRLDTPTTTPAAPG